MSSFYLKIPRLNQNDDKVILVDLRINVGSIIKIDDIVAVVESTKSTFEIQSPVSGKIKKINYSLKEAINVGEILCEIITDEEIKTDSVNLDNLNNGANQKESDTAKNKISKSGLSLKEKLRNKKKNLL